MIETERLLLRRLRLSDAPLVQTLAGEWDVAKTTATIPHPYEDGVAEAWIEHEGAAWGEGQSYVFAVLCDGKFIGVSGLLHCDDTSGELAYWIGKPYWGQGFATEAAQAVVQFGTFEKGLRALQARCLKDNPASARVIEKAGFRLLEEVLEPRRSGRVLEPTLKFERHTAGIID